MESLHSKPVLEADGASMGEIAGGCVVPFAGAVAFTATDAQSFPSVRVYFDGAVMVVQLERLRLVRDRVLAPQLFLNGSERFGHLGDLVRGVRCLAVEAEYFLRRLAIVQNCEIVLLQVSDVSALLVGDGENQVYFAHHAD